MGGRIGRVVFRFVVFLFSSVRLFSSSPVVVRVALSRRYDDTGPGAISSVIFLLERPSSRLHTGYKRKMPVFRPPGRGKLENVICIRFDPDATTFHIDNPVG